MKNIKRIIGFVLISMISITILSSVVNNSIKGTVKKGEIEMIKDTNIANKGIEKINDIALDTSSYLNDITDIDKKEQIGILDEVLSVKDGKAAEGFEKAVSDSIDNSVKSINAKNKLDRNNNKSNKNNELLLNKDIESISETLGEFENYMQ